MRAVMEACGNPQECLAAVHIAGTNGKGSVAAMTQSMLRQAGWKTGLYTSPHLTSVRERISTDGRPIHPRRFARLMSRLRALESRLLRRGRMDMPLTYFELVTCCMFLEFAEQQADLAVIEVGMGGALDATNLARPEVCVITGVSLDHQEFLGHSIAAIAAEKAGIIKTAAPVVSGCRAPAARRAVRRNALREGAPLVEVDRSCRIRFRGSRRGRCVIDLETPRRSYRKLRLGLAGEHQARNAALAVLAAQSLHGFRIPERAVRAGLARVRWPGRLDTYACRRTTLLDGAHNAEGARSLRNYLKASAPREIHLVLGLLKDKDALRIGRLLFPLGRSIHLARIASPRSADPAWIASLHERHRPRFRLHADSRLALLGAWRECPREGLVVVAGSLHLLGELMPAIRRDAARREP